MKLNDVKHIDMLVAHIDEQILYWKNLAVRLSWCNGRKDTIKKIVGFVQEYQSEKEDMFGARTELEHEIESLNVNDTTKQILTLYYIEGMKPKEISEELNLSYCWTTQLFNQGKRKLLEGR